MVCTKDASASVQQPAALRVWIFNQQILHAMECLMVQRLRIQMEVHRIILWLVPFRWFRSYCQAISQQGNLFCNSNWCERLYHFLNQPRYNNPALLYLQASFYSCCLGTFTGTATVVSKRRISTLFIFLVSRKRYHCNCIQSCSCRARTVTVTDANGCSNTAIANVSNTGSNHCRKCYTTSNMSWWSEWCCHCKCE